MNKCKIIKDLLPLYVENMVSEESKEFIENHIKECEDCKRELEFLKSNVESKEETFSTPSDGETESFRDDINLREEKAPLEFLNKEIKKDKKTTTLIRVSIVGIILVLFFHIMLTPIFYPFYNDLMDVTETEDSFTVELNYPGKLSYQTYYDEVYDRSEYVISAYKTKFDKFMPEKEKEVLILEKPGILEYDENNGSLLIDIRTKSEISAELLPKLTQNYYLIMAVIASIVMIIVGLIFRKKLDKLIYIIVLPISYVISHFLIYRGRTVTHTLVFDFSFTLGVCIFIYLLLIGIFKKYKINKRY